MTTLTEIESYLDGSGHPNKLSLDHLATSFRLKDVANTLHEEWDLFKQEVNKLSSYKCLLAPNPHTPSLSTKRVSQDLVDQGRSAYRALKKQFDTLTKTDISYKQFRSEIKMKTKDITKLINHLDDYWASLRHRSTDLKKKVKAVCDVLNLEKDCCEQAIALLPYLDKSPSSDAWLRYCEQDQKLCTQIGANSQIKLIYGLAQGTFNIKDLDPGLLDLLQKADNVVVSISII